LKVLLEKAIQSQRFGYTARSLRFFFLRSFALFMAPDVITGFGIAPDKHYNLVFRSFVLQID